tara:strand:- start:340 stop:729 length:390 start_codon:yes stop_codon:yes gene_type:complete
MSVKKHISTNKAPSAIGAYSQAVLVNNFLFISGQIPLVPSTMEVISADFNKQINQVFENISNIMAASGGALSDIIKLNVYLKNLENFQDVNDSMNKYFTEPFPARAAVEVSRLPKDVEIEIDAIAYIKN